MRARTRPHLSGLVRLPVGIQRHRDIQLLVGDEAAAAPGEDLTERLPGAFLIRSRPLQHFARRPIVEFANSHVGVNIGRCGDGPGGQFAGVAQRFGDLFSQQGEGAVRDLVGRGQYIGLAALFAHLPVALRAAGQHIRQPIQRRTGRGGLLEIHIRPRDRHQQLRTRGHLLDGKFGPRTEQCRDPRTVDQIHPAVLEQVQRRLEIGPGQRMVHRAAQQLVFGIPPGGPAVQGFHPARIRPVQAGPQIFGEQRLHLEPFRFVVGAAQEQLAPFGLLQ